VQFFGPAAGKLLTLREPTSNQGRAGKVVHDLLTGADMQEDMEGLAHKIVEFYERMSSWEHGVVKGSGLSPAQMHAIEILGMSDSCRMKELAEKLGVTTGSLTVMVDRLEKKGLLIRKPHESDRRSYMVVLTDKGREHYASHHKFHLKLTQDMAAVLTPEELEMFEVILDKVLPHI